MESERHIGCSWPKQEPLIPEIPREPIFEHLRKHALINPNKTAVNYYGYEISYAELNEASDRFATALIDLGLGKGDRIALYLENCPQFIISFYGILKMGGVVVTCSPMHKEEELLHELTDAGAKAILLLDSLYPVFDKIRSQLGSLYVIATRFSEYIPEKPVIPVHTSMLTAAVDVPDSIDFKNLLVKTAPRTVAPDFDLDTDLALLQYTAGTTGYAKGAMITHANIAAHNAVAKHFYQFTEDDVHCVILPLFHISGLDIAMNPALAAGGTLILFGRFDLIPILDSIEKYKVSVLVTIATINIAIMSFPGVQKYDLRSLRLVISGGAPVPAEFHPKWYELTGSTIAEGYGLSECCGGIIGNSQHFFLPGSVGSPVYYHDIKIMNPDNLAMEMPTGQEGELWIKGPCVMKGYWNAPEQTEQTLIGDWLRTGDIAQIDDKGWLSITGRLKEMIKVSGVSVFLAEIDASLYHHEAVAEVAAIGVPHPYRGEEAKLFIVPKPEFKNRISEQEILAWCKEKMAHHKCPGSVVFVDTLPKSGSGKVLRRELAQNV